MGDRRFPVLWVYPAFNDGAGFSGNGAVYGSLRRRQARYYGTISSVYPAPGHLGGEDRGAESVPGHQQQPGGVTVQPVDAPVYKRFSSAQKIISQAVCQRVVIIALGRVYRSAGGFINDQQVSSS